MPIWDDEELPAASQPQSISQRVRAGNALPILSHSALFDLALFGHESFKRFYAEKVGYPYPNLPDIGQLANYDRYTNRSSDGACKEFYLDCLKNHIFREARAAGVDEETLAEARGQYDRVGVTAFAHLLGYPRFDLPQTLPLQVLANLPFKTYLTISACASRCSCVASCPVRRSISRWFSSSLLLLAAEGCASSSQLRAWAVLPWSMASVAARSRRAGVASPGCSKRPCQVCRAIPGSAARSARSAIISSVCARGLRRLKRSR